VPKISIVAGSTSKLLDVFLQDSSSTTGAGLTGLVFNTASLSAYYYREGAASATAITLATMTLGTWATGGFVVVDGTNMPGVYQLGIPDAAIAAGAKSVIIMIKGAANLAPAVFEIELTAWNNQDAVRGGLTALPNANAAAANGLPILGTNATAISFTAGMTVSNATGDALTLSSGGSNGVGLSAAGNGTGAGIRSTGGATGHGISAVGGATSGDGLSAAAATSGHGITATGVGTTKHGVNATGGSTTSHGIAATGGGVGHGILATSGGGATGDGIRATAASTNGNGLNGVGVGTGAGLLATGGATGVGISGVGGASSGSGIKATGSAGNAIGLQAVGQGSAAGINATGGTTGHGVAVVGGGTSGNGLNVTTTDGHGVNLAPVGTDRHGILSTGGNGGTSDGIKAVAGTGGVPIRGDITGNITGNLSGSAGSVSGAVGSVTGNVGGNVVGSTASVTGAVGSVTGNVGGNVVGSVASVTGNVGGNVSGNVTGSVGSVATGGITRASLAADTGLQPIRSNTAQAGAAGTITLDASASAVDGFYADTLVLLTGGTGAGQVRRGRAYVGATKVLTVVPNWTTNPDNTSTFAILPATSVWDETLTDHLDSGSTGASLNAAGSAGDPWSTAIPGAYGAGTAGHRLGNVPDLVAGAAGGLFIAGTNAATTVNITGNVTGNLSGSVGSVTGAVGSVTGNVGGNVVGSVASVTAGVTLAASAVQAIWDALTSALTTVGSIGKLLVDNINATISSRLASASYTTPPTVGAIADQVWDEALAGHLTAGSTGAALSAAGSAGDPWSTALPGAYGAGTAGKIVGDNLNATITSRASQASVDTIDDFVDTEVSAIKAKTDNLPSVVKKNTALANFSFPMYDDDHVTLATGLSVTGTVSKDGGSFSSLTNAVTEVGGGIYKVNLAAADLNADFVVLRFTATGADTTHVSIPLQT